MVLFFLGITIGTMATLVANKREIDKLNDLLKQTENLVEDLHEELEMKDLITVNDLTNEGSESMKTGIPTAASLEQEELHRSARFDVESPENQSPENSEFMMSKIEAELEAELERLDQNMKGRDLDFVGVSKVLNLL